MSRPSHRVRCIVIITALAVGIAAVVRRSSSTAGGTVPVIGGDTWPPVPVKDSPAPVKVTPPA